MDPLKVYDYLTLARERVLDAVRPLTPEQYHRQFTFGLKSIGTTLTHIMISEWYYIERLEGRHVPPYQSWPIKFEHSPAFGIIEETWRKQAANTRDSIAAQRDWSRTIEWESFPNDAGKRFHITATAGGFFTQLVLHEVHHRAQLMAMLRELGDARPGPPLQDLDYNALMFERRETA